MTSIKIYDGKYKNQKNCYGTYIFYSQGSPYIKIGKSNDWRQRLAQINTSSATRYQCYAFVDLDIEKLLHKNFYQYRRNGEWFEIHPDKVVEYILHMIDGVNTNAIHHNLSIDQIQCIAPSKQLVISREYENIYKIIQEYFDCEIERKLLYWNEKIHWTCSEVYQHLERKGLIDFLSERNDITLKGKLVTFGKVLRSLAKKRICVRIKTEHRGYVPQNCYVLRLKNNLHTLN